MGDDYVRRSVICPCGGDLYDRTWDFSNSVGCEHYAIWRCSNCSRETPRIRRRVPTIGQLCGDAYLALKAEWEPVNDALFAKVEAGAPSGCLLVYTSSSSYSMKGLSEAFDTPVSRIMMRILIERAREDLAKARQFVGM